MQGKPKLVGNEDDGRGLDCQKFQWPIKRIEQGI